jgi:hypothetical protein
MKKIYINEQLKDVARDAVKELLYTWEVFQLEVDGTPFWVQYDHGSDGWFGYVFSKDPEDLDMRDSSNYLNRFDEPEYLGEIAL